MSEVQVPIMLKMAAGDSDMSNSRRIEGVIREDIKLNITLFCLSKGRVLNPSGTEEDEVEGDAADAGEGVVGIRFRCAAL